MTQMDKDIFPRSTSNAELRFAGLHLSGPNAGKTAVVALAHEQAGTALLSSPLRIGKVYEKIGAFGSLFSDERLCEILSLEGPFSEVFVDCPLSLPPCVACTRSVCPGVMRCEDVSVAYMLAISSKLRRRGARKARPVNPQSQRLWDVLQLGAGAAERMEPSYSANLAPLVARGMTLQRRLNAFKPRTVLKETQIPGALESLRVPLGLSDDVRLAYRSFEAGLEERRAVLSCLIEWGLIAAPEDAVVCAGYLFGEDPVVRDVRVVGEEAEDDDPYEAVVKTVENFHAFIAALVGAMHHAGMTNERPEGYVSGEGWVYLPEIEEPAAVRAP